MAYKKLWLDSWGFNVAKLLDYIAKEVKNRGGAVFTTVKKDKKAIISRYTGKKLFTYFGDCFGGYIHFELGENSYYLSFDSNPFFEHRYSKKPMEKEKSACYSKELQKELICFNEFDVNISNYIFKKTAQNIVNFLENAEICEIYKRIGFKEEKFYI